MLICICLQQQIKYITIILDKLFDTFGCSFGHCLFRHSLSRYTLVVCTLSGLCTHLVTCVCVNQFHLNHCISVTYLLPLYLVFSFILSHYYCDLDYGLSYTINYSKKKIYKKIFSYS